MRERSLLVTFTQLSHVPLESLVRHHTAPLPAFLNLYGTTFFDFCNIITLQGLLDTFFIIKNQFPFLTRNLKIDRFFAEIPENLQTLFKIEKVIHKIGDRIFKIIIFSIYKKVIKDV